MDPQLSFKSTSALASRYEASEITMAPQEIASFSRNRRTNDEREVISDNKVTDRLQV